MNDSTRGYKLVIALLAIGLGVAVVFAVTKKGGGGDDDSVARLNKVAADLEDCKTQRRELKDRLAQLETDLKKAQEQGANVINAGTITASTHVAGEPAGPAIGMDQVQKVIKQNTGGLKVCYERALKRDTGLQLQPIKVTFRFNIHPPGGTGETSLASDTHIDAQLVDCFKQAIGRWRFPSFGGQPIPIELPLPFQPIGGH
jgi:hypothetical protein